MWAAAGSSGFDPSVLIHLSPSSHPYPTLIPFYATSHPLLPHMPYIHSYKRAISLIQSIWMKVLMWLLKLVFKTNCDETLLLSFALLTMSNMVKLFFNQCLIYWATGCYVCTARTETSFFFCVIKGRRTSAARCCCTHVMKLLHLVRVTQLRPESSTFCLCEGFFQFQRKTTQFPFAKIFTKMDQRGGGKQL